MNPSFYEEVIDPYVMPLIHRLETLPLFAQIALGVFVGGFVLVVTIANLEAGE